MVELLIREEHVEHVLALKVGEGHNLRGPLLLAERVSVQQNRIVVWSPRFDVERANPRGGIGPLANGTDDVG